MSNLVSQVGLNTKYGIKEVLFEQIWDSGRLMKKIEISIKFYLTKLNFQYIYFQSGKKWEKVV